MIDLPLELLDDPRMVGASEADRGTCEFSTTVGSEEDAAGKDIVVGDDVEHSKGLLTDDDKWMLKLSKA